MTLCVLRTLREGENYGYGITRALADAGLGAVKGGTLYPLLARCEEAGWVTTRWEPGVGGPGRKYFALTDPGRTHLATSADQWRQFTRLTNDFLGAKSGHHQ